MTALNAALPSWAGEVLISPSTHLALREEGGRLVASDGEPAAHVAEGIARFALQERDDSIDFYRQVGGARFHERATVPYAMTALDTDVYHGYLAELRSADANALIVDVGGGDGRNTIPWLRWGSR